MAHFAKLDENNIVTGVYVIRDEDEETYAQWRATFGEKYVQTSYNTLHGVHRLGGTPLRKNYAGIGWSYDEERDAFIGPQPFPSWILNEETCDWEAPIPKPTDVELGSWIWDEPTLSWKGMWETTTNN
jgi:hypothetical protein